MRSMRSQMLVTVIGHMRLSNHSQSYSKHRRLSTGGILWWLPLAGVYSMLGSPQDMLELGASSLEFNHQPCEADKCVHFSELFN